MSQFRIEWVMHGVAILEADDRKEANELVVDGLENLDESMFDEFAVDEIVVEHTEEL